MVLKFNKAGATATKDAPTTETQTEDVKAMSSQIVGSSVSIPLTQEQIDLAEVFIRGRVELDEYRGLIKKVESSKEALADAVGTQVPHSEPAMVVTPVGTIAFSEAPDTRVLKDVDGLMKALRKKITRDAVLAMIKISLTEADLYIGKEEVEKYVDHAPGTRRVASYTFTGSS